MRVGKVLVVGAAEAGKSTLIGALSPKAVNLAVNGRTVAMDHATLDRDGRSLQLIGVPGQERFEPVREVLAAGARCALWVHRAGGAFDRATARLVASLATRGMPYVVYVNRPTGSGDGPGWVPPDGFPVPRAVLAGNPCAAGGSLEPLCDAIWRVVDGDPAPVSEKGTRGWQRRSKP